MSYNPYSKEAKAQRSKLLVSGRPMRGSEPNIQQIPIGSDLYKLIRQKFVGD